MENDGNDSAGEEGHYKKEISSGPQTVECIIGNQSLAILRDTHP